MTGHKEWLIDLDTSRSKKVKLAGSRTLNVERVGNIVIRRKDGKTTLIESVLFVPGMQCNLMSVGQLVEKGFSVIMQNDSLKLFDPNKRLVLRSSLSKNITFQANINVAYAKCRTTIVAKEESCLWHLRFGPLNFRSLSQLQSKDMVIALPNVHVPDRMCKVCSASKQPRNSFCSYLPMRSLELLHVVHSDVCGLFEVASLDGNKDYVSFVDEHIRMMWLFLIKAKN